MVKEFPFIEALDGNVVMKGGKTATKKKNKLQKHDLNLFLGGNWVFQKKASPRRKTILNVSPYQVSSEQLFWISHYSEENREERNVIKTFPR